MLDREPVLHPVAIDDLRPTQMTVGYREVARKRKEWEEKAGKNASTYLGQHLIPVVLGHNGVMWMLDNHHLVRALYEENVKNVLVHIIADLQEIKGRLFKTYMDNRNWFHPFDETGRRQKINNIPKHIAHLADDPYRSLAGEVRRAGGYAKDETPFSEFLWADFLRRHVDLKVIEEDFHTAIDQALDHARSSQASYLPGWAGPHDS